jgi:hypothetical protein
MASSTLKYRTLVTAPVDGKPDLKARQKRLNELAAEGWSLVTTVVVTAELGTEFVDTLSTPLPE